VPRVVRRSGDTKPRVLIVDDHRGVLNRVSATLSIDFDVAGTATDGRQALEIARQVRPDAIVLDIDMPVLDGFQTMRALEQAGSHAPVVFLSTLDSDDHVGEAFRIGAHGYVLKSHIARDLASALDQVILGRRFAPSLATLSALANGGGHAAHLYSDAESFLDELAAVFDMALRRGDATCVIATADVREGLGSRLRARGFDIGGQGSNERYQVVDADAALSRFMRNGLPAAGVIAEIAAELDEYRRSVAGAATRLTIYGNMVTVLLTQGNLEAAFALESQWNTVTRGLPFFTLCGYAMSCFQDHVPDVWSRACAEHSAVSHNRV
jgi:DNA-binding NarL/FixJ family response regulator